MAMPHAHVAERLEGLERAARRAHHRRLGELQLEQVRGESGLREGLRHVRHQVRVPDLTHRHVHADEDRRLVRVVQLPPPRLPAGRGQHPAAQLHDRTVLLGQSDEPIRRQYAELRMVPAHQRLDPAQPAVLHAHQRLVLQRRTRRARWPGGAWRRGPGGSCGGRCAPGRTASSGPCRRPSPSTASCRRPASDRSRWCRPRAAPRRRSTPRPTAAARRGRTAPAAPSARDSARSASCSVPVESSTSSANSSPPSRATSGVAVPRVARPRPRSASAARRRRRAAGRRRGGRGCR